jgi:hypothetical protein
MAYLPTVKPVAQPTSMPVQEPVCPAILYEIPRLPAVSATFTGYKVNVKRIVANGIGNKVIMDGYSAKPMITESDMGVFSISAGESCEGTKATIAPTKKPAMAYLPTVKPVAQPTSMPVQEPICPAISYELEKIPAISAAFTGYKVNVKRIIGKGVGNKVILSGYLAKPIISESAVGKYAISAGELCDGGNQLISAKPTIKPSRKPTSKPVSKPTTVPSFLPNAKPTSFPTIRPSEKPSIVMCRDNPSALFQLPKGGSKTCRKLASSKRRNRYCYDKASNASTVCPVRTVDTYANCS